MAMRIDGMAVPGSAGPAIGARGDENHHSASSENSGPLFRLICDEPLVDPIAAPVVPVASQPLPTESGTALLLQRGMDILIATIALMVIWPIMLVTALLVCLSGPGPIVYSHRRLGRGGKVFNCLKFRTMRRDADRVLEELLASSPALLAEWTEERKLRQDPRITTIGGFLRRYSIDELPQLFNVLRGDMSIVGPRPLATDESHYYADSYALYCLTNPGITGLWQVSGRNDVSYTRRVALDCEYVRTRSVRKDIWIILRTVPVVLRGTGY